MQVMMIKVVTKMTAKTEKKIERAGPMIVMSLNNIWRCL